MDADATLTFVVDSGETPVAATAGPEGQIDHRGDYEERPVRLFDARDRGTELEREGFVLRSHRTAVEDFHDPAMSAIYDREVEALIADQTGARRVVVFDKTVRSEDADEQRHKRLREPVGVAHNDYTERSGPNRLRLALPEEADALLERRFAIVQVWRPTHDPVVDRPLVLCDRRSVRARDLVRTLRRHRDRVGEIYNLAYHPDQRWHWFPAMRRNEAVVFKVYDSDPARARFTPHASAVLQQVPPDAPPRRSIEARALALF